MRVSPSCDMAVRGSGLTIYDVLPAPSPPHSCSQRAETAAEVLGRGGRGVQWSQSTVTIMDYSSTTVHNNVHHIRLCEHELQYASVYTHIFTQNTAYPVA